MRRIETSKCWQIKDTMQCDTSGEDKYKRLRKAEKVKCMRVRLGKMERWK